MPRLWCRACNTQKTIKAGHVCRQCKVELRKMCANYKQNKDMLEFFIKASDKRCNINHCENTTTTDICKQCIDLMSEYRYVENWNRYCPPELRRCEDCWQMVADCHIFNPSTPVYPRD